MSRFTFHLLPNAHLDPVWLWDWREGLNEGILTVRTVLDLMDRYLDLTFLRGESSIYEHLAAYAPDCMERIRKLIAAGRWDVVGGTYVQCDTNMPSSATMLRQFCEGKRFLKKALNVSPTAAWWPDSFGHSAGLPDLLSAAGMQSLAVSRPAPNQCELPGVAFWWEGAGGGRLLVYRMPIAWYGSDRGAIPALLDQHLEQAPKSGLRNVGVFMGLGNHGGGPCVQQIEEIYAWREAHPEVEVTFSTLHRFFGALRKETLPSWRGEMNFCMRGCYTSVAGHKKLYREAEALVTRAETLNTGVSALCGTASAELHEAWQGVLFNGFHDILPGSSIERAHREQIQWVGGVLHQARRAELHALNLLADAVDTRVPKVDPYHPTALPMLAFNPHAYRYRGPLVLQGMMDWRPIKQYEGQPQLPLEVRGPDGHLLPFQHLSLEDEAMPTLHWRKRVIVQADLPPLGWSLYTIGFVEGARKVAAPKTGLRAGADWIANADCRVKAGVGDAGVQIWRGGKKVFDGSGLTAVTVEDHGGSWGSHGPDRENHSKVRHRWKVTETRVLEKGPFANLLWVRLEGGGSRLDLRFALYAGREEVDVEARLLWCERAARLKLVMPGKVTQADFDVPGGVIRRGEAGEVPGNRWVRALRKDGRTGFGFASDLVYGFDITDGALRASIVRSTRFACGAPQDAKGQRWIPATDQGEHAFRFLIGPADDSLARLAGELEQPPLVQMVAPSKGKLGRSGSFGGFSSDNLRLLALKPGAREGDVVLWVQQTGRRSAKASLTWLGRKIALPVLQPWEIALLRLRKTGRAYRLDRVDITA